MVPLTVWDRLQAPVHREQLAEAQSKIAPGSTAGHRVPKSHGSRPQALDTILRYLTLALAWFAALRPIWTTVPFRMDSSMIGFPSSPVIGALRGSTVSAKLYQGKQMTAVHRFWLPYHSRLDVTAGGYLQMSRYLEINTNTNSKAYMRSVSLHTASKIGRAESVS